jgi:CheY-like chemotaxis protein
MRIPGTRTALLAGLLGVLLVVGAVSAVAGHGLGALDRFLRDLSSAHAEKARLLHALTVASGERLGAALLAASGDDPFAREEAWQQVQFLGSEFALAHERLLGAADSPEERALSQGLADRAAALREIYAEAEDTARAGDLAGARSRLAALAIPAQSALQADLSVLRELVHRGQTAELRSVHETLRLRVYAGLALAAAAAGLLALELARRIGRRRHRLRTVLGGLSVLREPPRDAPEQEGGIPGAGAGVVCRLAPRRHPASASALGTTIARPDFGPGQAAAGAVRVLVVEDNPVQQQLMVGLLHRLGCLTRVVGTGQEAIEAVTGSPAELILLDLQMPGLDGCETARRLRARESVGQRTPIVGLTAGAPQADWYRCRTAGIDEVLTKPCQIEDLIAVLSRAVGHSTTLAPAGAWDPSASLALQGMPVEVLRQVVASYLASARQQLASIECALLTGDLPALMRAAQTLREGSARVGAEALGGLATQLEEIGGASELEGAAGLLVQAFLEFERVESCFLNVSSRSVA